MTDTSVFVKTKSRKTIALSAFRKAIEACRSDLSKVTVQEEATYRYAIIRTYSKTLLTCCEVYILLNAGYPEGAFALSRSLHESAVIINKLLEGYLTNNELLIQKFFDAADITRIQIGMTAAKWVLEKDPNSQAHLKYLSQMESEFQQYKLKYPQEKFKPYWWADECTFRNLADHSGFTKDFYYKYACENMHFNAFSALNYLDKSENMLLLGATSNGIELPLWHSTHCLSCIARTLQKEMPTLVSIDTIPCVINAQQNATALLKRIVQPHE